LVLRTGARSASHRCFNNEAHLRGIQAHPIDVLIPAATAELDTLLARIVSGG
jgi:hypothetical protein